jgi:putative ABC transport system permease protein
LRGFLLGLQVTVSVLLLVVSGWLAGYLKSSFAKDSDLGFDTRDSYSLTLSGKDSDVLSRVRERLRTLPELSHVAIGSTPLNPSMAEAMEAGGGEWQAPLSYASDGYFETLGIPLLRGRGFTRQEADEGAPVAVITESTARRVWGNEEPLGRHLHFRQPGFMKFGDYVVAGVTRDVRFSTLTQVDSLRVFLPEGTLKIDPARMRLVAGLLFHIHGNRDKALIAVESAVQSVDPDLLRRMDTVSVDGGQLAVQRGFFRVIGAFAGVLTMLALTLAGIGIYGVMAFLVSQRTREIGIRVTLGATSRMVVESVVRQGLWPVLIGTLLGIAGAAGLLAIPQVRTAVQFSNSASLFRATFGDPVFYAELALVALIAVLASVIPARRALRVDPAVALRWE